MATDIELAAEAERTTTTFEEVIGNVKVQPREVDTITVGDTTDLGDSRACSLALVASGPSTWDHNPAALDVTIETSEDQVEWRDAASFDRFNAERGARRTQRIGFVADRYIRARWRISYSGSGNKGAVTFSVTGRAVGAEAT